MLEIWNGCRCSYGIDKDWRMGIITLLVLVVLAGEVGATGQRFQAREIIGAYASVINTSGCLGFGQAIGSNMKNWLQQLNPFQRPAKTGKYEKAMALADDIEKKMQERSASVDPFRAVMADIWFQHHDGKNNKGDTVLMTDAYQMAQESHICKGSEK